MSSPSRRAPSRSAHTLRTSRGRTTSSAGRAGPSATPVRALDSRPGGRFTDQGTGIDRDVVIERAEDRHRLRAGDLPRDIATEHTHALVDLVRSHDEASRRPACPPRRSRMRNSPPRSIRVDALIIGAQLGHRARDEHLRIPRPALRAGRLVPQHRSRGQGSGTRRGSEQSPIRHLRGAAVRSALPSVRSNVTPASAASVGAMSAGVAAVSRMPAGAPGP